MGLLDKFSDAYNKATDTVSGLANDAWDAGKTLVKKANEVKNDVVDASKNALNTVVETGKGVMNLGKGVVLSLAEGGKNVLNNVIDTVSNVTSVTNINPVKVAETVGTYITQPYKAVTDSVSAIASGKVSGADAISSIATFGALMNPLTFGSAVMTYAVGQTWKSLDNKMTFEVKASLKDDAKTIELDNIWASYEKSKAGGIVASADKNEQGMLELTNPYKSNEKPKQGDKKIAVEKPVVVRTGNETAQFDERTGQIRVSRDDLEMIQSGEYYEIKFKDGRIAKKDATGSWISDKTGQVWTKFDESGVTIQGRHHGFILARSREEMERRIAEYKRRLQECKRGAQAGDTCTVGSEEGYTATVVDGSESRTSLSNGTEIKLNRKLTTDGRQIWNAVIQMANGKVFVVDGENGVVKELRDGKWQDISPENAAHAPRIENGKLKVDSASIDLADMALEIADAFGEGKNARLKAAPSTGSAPGGVTLETPFGNVTGDQNEIKAPWGTLDLKTGVMDAGEAKIRPNEVELAGSGTRVDKDGVHFANGTSLRSDGTITFDGSGNNYRDAQGLESKAISTASGANSTAAAIYSKAASGVVKMSDLAALNNNLASITGLLGKLTSEDGDPGVIGQLYSSYMLTLNTIGFALPRAEATAIAETKGVTSESTLKQVQDGVFGSDPYKAADTALRMAA